MESPAIQRASITKYLITGTDFTIDLQITMGEVEDEVFASCAMIIPFTPRHMSEFPISKTLVMTSASGQKKTLRHFGWIAHPCDDVAEPSGR